LVLYAFVEGSEWFRVSAQCADEINSQQFRSPHGIAVSLFNRSWC